MFKNTFKVRFRFQTDNDVNTYFDEIEREVPRIPNKGEIITFHCRGDRRCIVKRIETFLKHKVKGSVYVVYVIYMPNL